MRISDWSSDVCSSDLPAEHAQPIIDRDEDDAAPCEIRAIVDWLGTAADPQRAAVDPDNDRGFLRMLGRPDVERQAILAHCRRRIGVEARRGHRGLQATRPETGGIAPALPAYGRRSDEHTSDLQSLMRTSSAR